MLSGKSNVIAHAKKIGPSLIFERLWEEFAILRDGEVMDQNRGMVSAENVREEVVIDGKRYIIGNKG